MAHVHDSVTDIVSFFVSSTISVPSKWRLTLIVYSELDTYSSRRAFTLKILSSVGSEDSMMNEYSLFTRGLVPDCIIILGLALNEQVIWWDSKSWFLNSRVSLEFSPTFILEGSNEAVRVTLDFCSDGCS